MRCDEPTRTKGPLDNRIQRLFLWETLIFLDLHIDRFYILM